MKDKIEIAWEKRAKIFKNKKEAVMQQSFPQVLNDCIHKLHAREVLRFLPRGKCKCLDIGCGYGRLAAEIVTRNKDAYVFGIDISKTFVDLFNKRLEEKGRAIAGDTRKLSYKSNSFDLVCCVATLMYLDKLQDQKKAIREILRVLKPQGIAVIIEPNLTGDNIIKLGGLLPFILRRIIGRKKVETFGISFPWGRIDELIRESEGKLFEKKGYPFLTIFFLPILTLSKISERLGALFFAVISKLDKTLSLPRLSHIITYIVIKP